MASRPEVTYSPEATTVSYSRASCSAAASRHHPTSSLVLPAMAETTTATSWPALTSRPTRRPTLRIQSTSATEVPPNFTTKRAMPRDLGTCRDMTAGGPGKQACPRKGAYTYRRGCGAATALETRGDMSNALQQACTVDDAEIAHFDA